MGVHQRMSQWMSGVLWGFVCSFMRVTRRISYSFRESQQFQLGIEVPVDWILSLEQIPCASSQYRYPTSHCCVPNNPISAWRSLNNLETPLSQATHKNFCWRCKKMTDWCSEITDEEDEINPCHTEWNQIKEFGAQQYFRKFSYKKHQV